LAGRVRNTDLTSVPKGQPGGAKNRKHTYVEKGKKKKKFRIQKHGPSVRGTSKGNKAKESGRL